MCEEGSCIGGERERETPCVIESVTAMECDAMHEDRHTTGSSACTSTTGEVSSNAVVVITVSDGCVWNNRRG